MYKLINPDMIVLARESRGYTQSELADLLGVSQGKISKIESGMLNASSDLVEDLVRVLYYPQHFFSQTDPIYGIGASLFYHRKRQSLPNKDMGRVHAQVNIQCMHITRLLRSVNVPEGKFKHYDIDEYDGDIEMIARAARASWLIPRGPIKNLTKSIEDAGGIVIKCDFGTRLLDALSHWVPGVPPLFFFNQRIPGDRLRFTLAHEIGHTFMHRTINPDMEDQAHKFAAEFLMPKEEIAPSLSNLNLQKLANLKLYWKVSMAAILHRAFDIGKITQTQNRYLWVQLSKAGYKTKEPAELDIPVEDPSLLKEIIDTHRFKLKYGVSELSHLLAISEQEVKSTYLGQKTHLSVINKN